MGRTEQTVSQIEIPAGNWAAHQLRLVYDDTKDLFSSRFSHREESAKFLSQYNIQFMPRASRPTSFNGGSSTYRSSHNERNATMSSIIDDKRRGDSFNRPYGTIKEAMCPESTQPHDFRDWNIPTRLLQEKLHRKENQPTVGQEIRDLSASLDKVKVEMDSCELVTRQVLPTSAVSSETPSRNFKVSSKCEKKNTNTTWKLPAVSKLPNKVVVRQHTEPELKKFSSSSPMSSRDEKGSRSSVGKYSAHKNRESATEVSETKKNGNNVKNNRKKTVDAMRMAELHYKIDCVLKRALFPDIYHTIKKRLFNLPTEEQEMILKFFKKKAETIPEVRRTEKLKELLNFLMRGKQFGMENSPKKIKENHLNNLRSKKLLSPRRQEKRFELTTWHHRPIYKPAIKCTENTTSIFVNTGHMPANHRH